MTTELSLEQKFPLLGMGLCGVVFKMSETTAAKFPVYAFSNERYLPNTKLRLDRLIREEFEIAQELYSFRVRVPRPIGIEKLKLPYIKNFGCPVKKAGSKKYDAFVMEFIPGTLIQELKEEDLPKAQESLFEEIQKAEAAGYYPFDYSQNAIWSPEKGGVVLIDFGEWGRIKK